MAPQDVPGLVEHLFRREAGKMVSYLTRLLGLSRLHLAEDVVQDTLFQALQTWSMRGLPDNPSAWLMRVARNRAIDLIRRDEHFKDLTLERQRLQQAETAVDEPVPEREIQDDQLRMMFACCHPGLSTEVQVTLILKTLCGFSVQEIAHALLASADSIEKRLGRARRFLREAGTFAELTNPTDLPGRVAAVHQAIYLLFSEGYHGSRSERTVREDLCFEALRLALLLSEHPAGARPTTFALVALFCFDAARLMGRVGAEAFLIPLEQQDRSRWNQELIGRGFSYLERSASQTEVSAFHLEAGIAALHSSAAAYASTDWPRIVELYDRLYGLTPTPIVALNRAIAVGQAQGPAAGLHALESLDGLPVMKAYPFYPAAQGEFHRQAGNAAAARACFEQALRLARNSSEVRYLERKLEALQI